MPQKLTMADRLRMLSASDLWTEETPENAKALMWAHRMSWDELERKQGGRLTRC